MLMIVFFERFSLLSCLRRFGEFVVGANANGTTAFSGATSGMYITRGTPRRRKAKLQAVIDRGGMVRDAALWASHRHIFSLNLEVSAREALRQQVLRRRDAGQGPNQIDVQPTTMV